jgi:hypothetical protein
MSRRIVTASNQALAAPSVDGFFDKLFKYIPAEINAAWIAVTGILAGLASPSTVLLWILFVVFILLTIAVTYRLTMVKNQPTPWIQIAISAVAFIVWVLALGGPFATIPGYNTAYGSIVLIIYTVVVPLVNP